MAFVDYSSEILGWIPEVGILGAQRMVNRAWRDIRESPRLWSWNRGEGVWYSPNLINAGSVTVTQFSATVSLSATANAALNNLNNPLITQRQFRGPGSNGGVYSIIAYDNALATLTLDRLYVEQSMTGGSYQVYRCYYQPQDASGNLITDFLTLYTMKNPDLGYNISQRGIRSSQQWFNANDPYRADQGYAFFAAPYKYDAANNVMLYELWPHPVYQSGYIYIYQKRGQDFVNPTDSVPATFPYHPLVERAKYYGCMWANMNQGRFPQLKGVNWLSIAMETNKNYERMMIDARRQDDEIALDTFIDPEYGNVPLIDEDLQVSSLLSIQSASSWQGG